MSKALDLINSQMWADDGLHLRMDDVATAAKEDATTIATLTAERDKAIEGANEYRNRNERLIADKQHLAAENERLKHEAERRGAQLQLLIDDCKKAEAERDGLAATLETARELHDISERYLRRIADHLSGAKPWNASQGTDLHLRQSIFEPIDQLREEAELWKQQAETAGRFELQYVNERDVIKKIVGHDESGPTLIEHVAALCDELAGLKAGNHGLKFDADYQRGRANTLEKEADSKYNAGVNDAAKWVQKRLDDYKRDCGTYDNETGVMEFSPTGAEYVEELDSIVEGIKAITPADPSAKGATQ